MKLLLTSGGISNPTLHNALIDLLDKPTADCSALCIATANFGQKMQGPMRAYQFVTDSGGGGAMVGLGWKSMGLLELSAISILSKDYWVPLVEQTDVLLVNGGDPMFLHYWMVQSGLPDVLPDWKGVYVGLSAGSMVMTPRIGEDFVNWKSPSGDDKTLGIVDFSIFPHLDNPGLPDNTMPTAEQWASQIDNPCYVIDDSTGIQWIDGQVEVFSEGRWELLNG